MMQAIKSLYSLKKISFTESNESARFPKVLQGCAKDPRNKGGFCLYGIGLKYFNVLSEEVNYFEIKAVEDGSDPAPPITNLVFLDTITNEFAFSLWQSDRVFITSFGTNFSAPGSIITVNGYEQVSSSFSGCVQCLMATYGYLFAGTEQGVLQMYHKGHESGLFCLLAEESGCHRTRNERRLMDGVLSIACIEISETHGHIATSGSDGNLNVWRLESSTSEGLKLLEMYRTDSTPIISLLCLSFANEKVVFSGSEEGLVAIWSWDNDSKELNRLASINASNSPVHCLATCDYLNCCLNPYDNEKKSAKYVCYPVILFGNDEGEVYTFFAHKTTSQERVMLQRSPWSRLCKAEFSSPVVSIQVSDDILLVGTCEGGIEVLRMQEFLERAKKDEYKEFLKSNKLGDVVENLNKLSDEEDFLEEAEEEDYIPQPRQLLPTIDFNSIPLPRDDIALKKVGNRLENENTSIEDKSVDAKPKPREMGLHVESNAREIASASDKEICPSIPSSKLHAPSLNSTLQIKIALEKLKLQKMDVPNVKGFIQEAKSKLLSMDVKGCAKSEINTESMYSNLISVKETPYKRRPVGIRKVAKQLPHDWNYKASLAELAKPARGQKNSKVECKTSKKQERKSQFGGKTKNVDREEEPWYKTRSNLFPWARQEYYLTSLKSGKVGFRNFHSLEGS